MHFQTILVPLSVFLTWLDNCCCLEFKPKRTGLTREHLESLNESLGRLEREVVAIRSELAEATDGEVVSAETDTRSIETHLMWPLSNLSHRLQHGHPLQSPRFWSHQYGYLLQAELEIGVSSYLLKVRQCHGNYDARLPQPFSSQLKMTVYNVQGLYTTYQDSTVVPLSSITDFRPTSEHRNLYYGYFKITITKPLDEKIIINWKFKKNSGVCFFKSEHKREHKDDCNIVNSSNPGYNISIKPIFKHVDRLKKIYFRLYMVHTNNSHLQWWPMTDAIEIIYKELTVPVQLHQNAEKWNYLQFDKKIISESVNEVYIYLAANIVQDYLLAPQKPNVNLNFSLLPTNDLKMCQEFQFSESYSYKFNVCVYPNGVAAGQPASLFVYLVYSLQNNLLQWPLHPDYFRIILDHTPVKLDHNPQPVACLPAKNLELLYARAQLNYTPHNSFQLKIHHT